MNTEIQATALLVFAYESTSVSDGLFFEIYTRIGITPKQEAEIAGDKISKIKIPSFNYHYIDSEESQGHVNEAFDIIFKATAKSLWPDSDPNSYIDNIRQLGI
ncbi:MAG: hypothetical protein WC466_06625 [Candidatus Izemoplasmatales bacterium]|jgi:hypothetical protein